ncbi:MAG: hypothetical protein JW860_02555, partial [Sedimentisphaerales bacterium]|nr:hypothetical protein [Sedimentisphaerales bacterium]
IVDLAYPVPFYPPLRLASRFSNNVQITQTDDRVTIFWPKLGLNKQFDNIPGHVSATVVLKTAPDGKSVIMTCEIDNQSEHDVGQVMFPDFMGLLAFDGDAQTKFTTAGCSIAPFEILKTPEERLSYFYAVDEFYKGSNWIEFIAGSYNDQSYYQSEQKIQGIPRAPGIHKVPGGTSHMMILDWMDLGSNKGGISLYPRRWGWDARPKTMLHLSPQTNKLRMLSCHSIKIPPGGKWQSQEYWLTPHRYGWAEGITSYEQWAKEHIHRKYAMPDRIKQAMGYRTALMSTITSWSDEQPSLPVFENDKDFVYTYGDLPELAKECAGHGLDELVLWVWGVPWHAKNGLQLPLKTTFPAMGTLEELADRVKQCKTIGVNTTLFISVLGMREPLASRYGVKIKSDWSWTYHPDMIPQFNPEYKLRGGFGLVDTSNEAWRKDVLRFIQALADSGLSSIAWDVYIGSPKTPNVYSLTDEIREITVRHDPQATFAAESINNIELEADHLDYTWNWMRYEDIRPFNRVFPAPRLNANIDNSPREVKLCFVDNVMMNIMPTVPGNVNGSDSIANNPGLSKALKQCSNLRKQFMDYFTDGKLIGDCILTQYPPEGFHVSAYALPDSILMLVLNTSGEKSKIPLECDLAGWLESDTGKYKVNIYNSNGKLIRKKGINKSIWKSKTSKLPSLDIEIYEFRAR